MDPRDLPPLRSGLGGDAPSAPPTADEQQRIAAVLCCFCEDAVRDAARITEARNESVVTADTLIRCLKLQALPESGFLTQADIAARAERHFVALGADSDSEAEATEATEATQAPKATEAIDGLLARFETADDNFDAWEPADAHGRCLKRALLNTALQFAEE